MEKIRFAIVTRRLPPAHCGIGDYSVCLANALRTLGHHVDLISGEGEAGIKIDACDWRRDSWGRVLSLLGELQPSHVLLQFTPQLYLTSNELEGTFLTEFWGVCRKKWHSSLIIHETYFLAWWYPPSWIRGRRERQLLRELVSLSNQNFSASHPLVEEMLAWDPGSHVSVLPIGSNIPMVTADRDDIRERNGFEPRDVVITLFGGGNSLRWLAGHVTATDRLLRQKGIGLRWVLLGGVPGGWFNLKSPYISLGRMSESDISEWLQASDIFILPHFAGLCAKRGTLMAAMGHSLPVVGTDTEMTDQFWRNVGGVSLVSRWSARRFATAVMSLASDKNKMVQYGKLNQIYFDNNFTWECIAAKLLRVLVSE
jgi:glycosyltransferase involved in cell wall biosynthesis